MARAWCLMKPGGVALVGLPAGPDKLEFNVHRIYGTIQLPHFFANWKQVYTEAKLKQHHGCSYCHQPLFVVRKPESI